MWRKREDEISIHSSAKVDLYSFLDLPISLILFKLGSGCAQQSKLRTVRDCFAIVARYMSSLPV